MIAIAFASPPASPAIANACLRAPRGRKLRLQDRLREQHRPPHATGRANIYNLVLICPSSAASGMNTPDRNSKPANNRTVLVLDGDVLVRMPVVQFLRDCGYRVVEAASTDEAMAIFQKTNFPIDVVLSEIDIPGSMNGFGFAQWARSVRPELKILLAGTPERAAQNAAELCEIEPML